MEQTIYQFGDVYLRWEDKNGNIWEAVKEQVEFLGKECFECDPFNEDYLSDCLISPSEETLDFVDSFFEE